MDIAIQNALANESRRQELRGKVQALQGQANMLSAFASDLSATSADISRRLQTAQAELSALEAGAGPGITDTWGDRATFLEAFIAKAHQAGLIPDEAVDGFKALI